MFTLTTAGPAGEPERWARAAFERVAGLQGQFIWRVLLGLRLRRTGADVAGWRIAGRGDDWIRLEARSWMLAGYLVVQVEGDRVSLATGLRYDRWPASAIWTPLSAVHRRLAPGLLRDAYRAVGT
ncbi:hypothetical protein HII36_52205 [Nonomuraea sp. NN258]|nr:hypothetical protein [Nonomuraea antri]